MPSLIWWRCAYRCRCCGDYRFQWRGRRSWLACSCLVACGLASDPIVRLLSGANGTLASVCVVSIYRVPKMYSISLSDVSCTSPFLRLKQLRNYYWLSTRVWCRALRLVSRRSGCSDRLCLSPHVPPSFRSKGSAHYQERPKCRAGYWWPLCTSQPPIWIRKCGRRGQQ